MILALTAVCAHAETNEVFPVVIIGDRTLSNVTVRVLNPAEVVLVYNDGSALKTNIAALPEPLRSRFYDPIKADEYLGKIAAEKTEQEARIEAKKKAIERMAYEKTHIVLDGKTFDKKDERFISCVIHDYSKAGNLVKVAVWPITERVAQRAKYVPSGEYLIKTKRKGFTIGEECFFKGYKIDPIDSDLVFSKGLLQSYIDADYETPEPKKSP